MVQFYRDTVHAPLAVLHSGTRFTNPLHSQGMGWVDRSILQIKRKKIERRGVERNFVFVPLNAHPGREGEKGERLLKPREGGVFVKAAG